MMLIVDDVSLAVGNSLIASIIAKVTVTMVLTLVAVQLAHTRRAAVRHLLLAAGFAVLLALPIASFVAPAVPIVEVPVVAHRISPSPALTPPSGLTPAVNSVSSAPGKRTMIPSARVSAAALLLTGWATGTLLFLLRAFVGLWQVHTLRQLGRPWRHGQSVVQQVAADVEIHRRVDVLLHEAISGPVTCGVVRTTIVLPTDAQLWHEDDLGRAITHELEHVRRGDWLSQCLAQVVCAAYWFHPLVWVACRQLVLEAERACDDAVLQRTEASTYADQLVAFAERMSRTSSRPMLAMANRTDLAARVTAVLDVHQQRGRAGRVCLAVVCVVAVLLVTAIAPLRITAAQAQAHAPAQTFTGSLMDPLGRPLPDTRLTLWTVSTRQPIEARSDRAGRFTFSGIPAGEYLLQVHDFGSQGRITLAPGQHLHRGIAVVMDGIEDTITVYGNEAPPALPPPPVPPSPPSRPSSPYPGQAQLDRCAGESMFCRVTPPVQIARAQPTYPAKRRESGVAGTVVVEGRVGRDGLVEDLRAVAPADPDFASATIDALRRWRFTPIRFDGVPVEMTIRVTANFVIQ